MTPIDHERFSERLKPYISGTLGPDETEEVRAHLAECPMCRQEEAALIALTAAPLEGLRPEESERLRAAVLAEITAPEKPALASVAPSKAAFVEPRRSWAPRIAQFMAAAAVIALTAIYLTNPQVGPIMGGSDDAEVPAAVEDAEGERSGERRGRDNDGGGTGTVTNDGDVADEEASGFDSDATGAGGSDPESEGRTIEAAGDEIAAVGGGPAPTQGTGNQLAAKANRSAFGAGAAYHRQQR